MKNRWRGFIRRQSKWRDKESEAPTLEDAPALLDAIEREFRLLADVPENPNCTLNWRQKAEAELAHALVELSLLEMGLDMEIAKETNDAV